ncbi:MAG: 4Fe-4S binding protein [Candidatus Bipolaricaulia bacterium]
MVLKSYKDLPLGGVISAAPERGKKKTGDWRAEKPVYKEELCVNCLLCWVRCPEVAILTEGQRMAGFDYDYCKGCGICAYICPTEAIEMVPEEEEVPLRGRIEGRKNGNEGK